MPEWLTIEVFDGEVPASGWQLAYENALVEAAVTHGASFWDWHTTRWGVVLELVFDSDERLERYRSLPVIRAAPVAGAAALPQPAPEEYLRLGSDAGTPAEVLSGR
jgi:hypothetical protein